MQSSEMILESVDPEIRRILLETGALLHGHFLLTSGRHSAFYFQGMRLLQHPHWASLAAGAVAGALEGRRVDATFAPAVGGIIWGFALAQQLPNCRALFAERVEGKMTTRRSFEIHSGEKILLAEDVVTTGGTVMELKALAEAAGAEAIGVAAVLDRSGGAFAPGCDVFAWARMAIETWTPDVCPLCAAGSQAIKPGSRGLK